MNKYILWNYECGYRVIEASDKEAAQLQAEATESEYMGEYDEATKDMKNFIAEEETKEEE